MIKKRVTKRSGVRYDVRLRGPDGKGQDKTFRTRADAERYEREVLRNRDRGEWIDPSAGRITLSEWATEWMESQRGLRPASRRIYESNMRLHILPVLGAVRLGRLNRALIDECLTHISTKPTRSGGLLSPASVHQAYRTLNRALEVAVESERIARNPMTGVSAPRINRRVMRFLTSEEVGAVAAAIEPRYRAFVLVAAYCGLREGELRALRRRHINPLHRSIAIVEQIDERDGDGFEPLSTKNDTPRRAVLPAFLATELADHLDRWVASQPDAFVFTAPNGGPIRIENFRRRVWNPAFVKAGIPAIRLHDLRHTCASLAINAGADIKALQAMLGHSSAAITLDLYGHLMPGAAEGVAERLDTIGRAAEEVREARPDPARTMPG